jgi:hypothetical protein
MGAVFFGNAALNLGVDVIQERSHHEINFVLYASLTKLLPFLPSCVLFVLKAVCAPAETFDD